MLVCQPLGVLLLTVSHRAPNGVEHRVVLVALVALKGLLHRCPFPSGLYVSIQPLQARPRTPLKGNQVLQSRLALGQPEPDYGSDRVPWSGAAPLQSHLPARHADHTIRQP